MLGTIVNHPTDEFEGQEFLSQVEDKETMQSLQAFNNGAYSVRTFVRDETPYFCGRDVAKALGYKCPAHALANAVFEEDRVRLSDIKGCSGSTPLSKNEQGHSLYITESGVYALIFGSQKEEARAFKKWVCSEVLPRLRKQYQEQMRAPLNLRNESDLHHKVVQAIRRLWPHALICPGLGELQDSPEKRLYSWRAGYLSGQPDILILNNHKTWNGYALELKSPKGSGKLTDKQFGTLGMYRRSGFQCVVSDEYDVILHSLFEYFLDIRLLCPHCCKKFKTEQTLRTHCSKFHKC